MPLPALSDEDKTFLRAILANPAELTARLAYADWLTEHDAHERAEFVRLQAGLAAPAVSQAEVYRAVERLSRLRPALDPDWVAIFDRPPVENCDELFAFKCPKKWERLTGTADPNVRHCETCQKEVFYCTSLAAAREHAQQGHCVAVAEGVARFPGDLTPVRKMSFPIMGLMRTTEPEPEPEPEPAPAAAPAPPEPSPAPAPKRPWWKFW